MQLQGAKKNQCTQGSTSEILTGIHTNRSALRGGDP